MTPAEVFRRNLHALAKVRFDRPSPEALADALGYQGKDRKWVRRIWTGGLQRPDKRRVDHLGAVCRFFKIRGTDLWSPGFKVQPEHLIHDHSRFTGLVADVLHVAVQLRACKDLWPEEVAKDQGKMSDAEYVAALVASDRRENPLWSAPTVAAGWRGRYFETFLNDLDFGPDPDDLIWGPLGEYVWERAVGHPGWPAFVELTAGDWRKQTGNEANDLALLQYVTNLSRLIRSHPLTHPQVWERFRREWLLDEPDPLSDRDERVFEVLKAVKAHPQWGEWWPEEAEFEGDKKEYVADRWRQVKDKVTVDQFVDWFCRHVLEAEDDDAPPPEPPAKRRGREKK